MSDESIKVVESVMRHSTPVLTTPMLTTPVLTTPVLTLNTYGHLFPGQCEGAPIKLAAMMSRDRKADQHTKPA